MTKRSVRWSQFVLMAVLSPALLHLGNCGNPHLSALEVEAGSLNRVVGFGAQTHTYKVWTDGADTIVVRATASEASSVVDRRLFIDGVFQSFERLGTGGGTATLTVPPDAPSELQIDVNHNGELGRYTVEINPPCVAGECDDANQCKSDACVSSVCEFTPEPDGMVCDLVSGAGICNAGLCRDCAGASTAWGDPHLITFDRRAYDLQTVGEFILTCPPLDTGGAGIDADCLMQGFGIQARTAPWPSPRDVSVNIAIAANVGGNVVSLYVDDPGFVFIDQVRQPLSAVINLTSGGSVEPIGAVTELTWPTGEFARIIRRQGYFDVHADIGGCAQDLVGLWGNADGDPDDDFWPRGATAPLALPVTFDELVHVFGDSWRITQAESLFEYGPAEDTTNYTDLSFPLGRASTADLTPAVRADAESVCQSQGVVDPVLLDACILDYGLTQDSAFLASYDDLEAPTDALVLEAASCAQILEQNPTAQSGTYQVDLSLGAPQLVYCDMEHEGGGWTLVASMDGWNFCGGDPSPQYDLLTDPTMQNGKISDALVELIRAASGRYEVMYYLGLPGRSEYVWQNIESPWSTVVADLTHCVWSCADGTTDSTTCGSESRGCGLGGHGTSGNTKKLYLGFNGGLHSGAGFCGLDNRPFYPVQTFVR